MEIEKQLQELVQYIIQAVVTKPDKAKIHSGMEQDALVIEIEVDKDDIGRVLGKSGKTINSIRTIVIASAIRMQIKSRIIVEVEIDDK